ncbi:MAG: TetR/AcrR family transcriptional regulator [Actinomycetota bacterium]
MSVPENAARRELLADAGLRVLAASGARGLTHRAVDAEADVPRGTCGNYFSTRDSLLAALAERVLVRIAPTPERLAELQDRPVGTDLMVDYITYIVERTTDAPELTMALFELRLEASRRPALAAALGATLRAAFRDDVAFNESRGLPGGATEIALLHFAIDGLLLDQLTVPLDTDLDHDEAVRLIVERLVGRAPSGG